MPPPDDLRLFADLRPRSPQCRNRAGRIIWLAFASGKDVPVRLALTASTDIPRGVPLERGQDGLVQWDHAARACLDLRFAHSELFLVNEVDLPPSQFAQLVAAESAVQIHHEGGVPCSYSAISELPRACAPSLRRCRHVPAMAGSRGSLPSRGAIVPGSDCLGRHRAATVLTPG